MDQMSDERLLKRIRENRELVARLEVREARRGVEGRRGGLRASEVRGAIAAQEREAKKRGLDV